MNKKNVIFFDGDGTLWYPKSTKRKTKPHWIYTDPEKKNDFLNHLILTPALINTLKRLKQSGVLLVALSTHPHTKKEADQLMSQKISHFKLQNFFDAILTARDKPSGKGEAILRFLKTKKMPKSKALMVGDSYLYDYLSAKEIGVDSYLIETEYNADYRQSKKPKTVKHLKELLWLLND